MTLSKKRLELMAKRPIDESPLKLKGNLTETQLLEHASEGGGISNMSKLLLIESSPVKLSLTESEGGKLIARGEFGRCGVPTKNGRNYPEDIMQREIDRLSEALSSRAVHGMLDHPESGKTSLGEVSHIITDLKIKDGIVVGEAEILNTRKGQDLRALIEADVQIGISSRGYGSTQPGKTKEEGEIVQSDFVLKTYDFVADPAMRTAIPRFVSEDMDEQEASVAEMFLAEFPEVAEEIKQKALSESEASEDASNSTNEEDIKKRLSENFERQLAEALIEAKEDLSSSLREEYSSDPEVGGAKAVLSAIAEMVSAYRADPDERAVQDAIKASELAVSEAKEKEEAAAKKAVKFECMAHVEREIGGHHMAETVRTLVKDQDFDSLEDAKEKLSVILKDLPEKVSETSEAEQALKTENAELNHEVSLLTERVDVLKGKLQRAVEIGEEVDGQLKEANRRLLEAEEERDTALLEAKEASEKLDTEVYKHSKVVGLSNGRELLDLMEDVTSKGAVDKLVSKRGVGFVSDGDLAEMRKKLGRGRGERQQMNEGESQSERPQTAEERMSRTNMDEMAKLAGIEG